jgi:hypothetical protein
MENKDKIVARVKILPKYINEKTKNELDLREYYGDWYPFDETELDVYLYSQSFLNKEKTLKEVTYSYKLPNGQVKLIPGIHCKVVYEFL